MSESRHRFREDLDEVSLRCGDLAAGIAGHLRKLAEWGVPDEALVEALRAASARTIESTEDLEQMCASLVLREQPVAGDLRMVLAVLRLVNNIERSARLLEHTAEALITISSVDAPAPVVDAVAELRDRAVSLFEFAVTAFRSGDVDLAEAIRRGDDAVDTAAIELRRVANEHWAGAVSPAEVDAIMATGLVGRYLERIGDHATVLGSEAIYVRTGDRG
ncbi:MAG: phosphate uptake regulator PhoU [Acidimicrobiales bacterium]